MREFFNALFDLTDRDDTEIDPLFIDVVDPLNETGIRLSGDEL